MRLCRKHFQERTGSAVPSWKCFSVCVSLRGGLVADARLNGVLNQLASAMERQLLFQMSLIRFDCLYAEVQFLSNLACTPPFADQPEYFKLTIGKCGEAGIHIRRTAADVLVKELVCHAIAEIDVAPEDTPHRNQHFFRRLCLHDVPISPRT